MSFGSEFGEFPDVGILPTKWRAVQFERPVVLLGVDLCGQEVTTNASTVVVGAKGCILRSATTLPFEGRVSLCCNQKVIEGDLKFSEPLDRNFSADLLGRQQYAFCFDHSEPRFWETTLPVVVTQERYELECSACHFCMSTELTELDEMVFIADSAVVLQCPGCKADTRFGAAQARLELLDVEQDPNLVVSGHHIYHMQPSRKEVNERKFARIPSKAKACVRLPGTEDELVNVLDMSRGGLRFESAHNYEQGAECEVATHYVEGGNNIFQKAKIVRKHRRPSAYLPGEYGVMFLSNTKNR